MLASGNDGRTPRAYETVVEQRLGRVAEACSRAPFWKQRLREAGLLGERVDQGALGALPLLSKDELIEELDYMLDPRPPRRAGST